MFNSLSAAKRAFRVLLVLGILGSAVAIATAQRVNQVTPPTLNPGAFIPTHKTLRGPPLSMSRLTRRSIS